MNDTQLDEAFAETIREWLPPGDPLLVAVSGGRDSMALLHFLHAAGCRGLVVCHVNHSLRGEESDLDETLVRRVADRLGLSFEGTRVDVRALAEKNRVSVEVAARNARYEWFAEVAKRRDCPRVLTAHHSDDQVETILINFFRGSGTRGIAGMGSRSMTRVGEMDLEVLRPFLTVSRSEINRYVAEEGIDFREDESNMEEFALRNRVRHRLLPILHEVFGRDISAPVLRFAELARRLEEWMEEAAGDLPREGSGLAVARLREMPEALRDRILLKWLREEGVPDCGFAEVARIGEVLLSNDRPAKASLPGDRHVRRREGVLFLE